MVSGKVKVKGDTCGSAESESVTANIILIMRIEPQIYK